MLSKTKQSVLNNHNKISPIIQTFMNDKVVLDIGCGNGLSSYYFKKIFNSSVILSDIDDNRIKESINFPFYKFSIEEITNKSILEKIDVIIIKYVIHHMDPNINLNKVLQNLKSIAKIIIIVEEIKTKKTNLKQAIEYDSSKNSSMSNGELIFFNYYTNNQLINIFKQNNLKILRNRKFYNGSKRNGYLEKRVYVLSKI